MMQLEPELQATMTVTERRKEPELQAAMTVVEQWKEPELQATQRMKWREFTAILLQSTATWCRIISIRIYWKKRTCLPMKTALGKISAQKSATHRKFIMHFMTLTETAYRSLL